MTPDLFETYRPLLFSIAYRMLGTATEADDILQEAYLRVQNIANETIEHPKTYLTTIVTRLCLNELSSAKKQRELYVGPWLPEPILTENHIHTANPAETIIKDEAISIAFLVLLEALSPAERAVFLLREVFDYSFKEIGEMLDKRPAACRQLFRRAKQHIEQNRPRFEANPVEHERLLRSFIEVVELGEVDAFLHMLAEDVSFVPDGGGQRGAAIHVLQGREAVSKFIFGVQKIGPSNLQYELTKLNGEQAILARTKEGFPFFALFLYHQAERVQLIHVIAGRKLAALKRHSIS